MTTTMAIRVFVLVSLLLAVLGAGRQPKDEMLTELDQRNGQVLERSSTHTFRSSPRRKTKYNNYYPNYNHNKSQQRPSTSPVAVLSPSSSANPANPSSSPSSEAAAAQSSGPVAAQSSGPAAAQSSGPAAAQSSGPAASPSSEPAASPSSEPTTSSSSAPSSAPSSEPTSSPSSAPTSLSPPIPAATPASAPASIEDDGFVIQESTVRFFPLSRIGLSVTTGASATLSFDIPVTAVHASVLAAMDEPFKTTLVGGEVAQYEALVTEYEESLDIPFMEFLNANLATDVSLSDLREGCDSVENCPSKTRAGRRILENQLPTRVRLTGEITASGTSAVPTTVFPLFRAADVLLSNGERVVIISSNPSDVSVGTGDGTILSSGADSYTVREE